RSAQIGTVQEVLFEEPAGDFYVGHTPNYIKVYIPQTEDLHNQIRSVQIIELYSDGALGKLI
ncbi:MAG: TRAM domain-containing protein, partial [Oscillospiraceae bacterium]|nr:TRAM domain-containing protein [Oscillospiraceae bacterium]